MAGPLKNHRYELFAQAIAKGETADAAYVSAGYRPNRGNAATLKANQSIQERVDELLSRAAIRTELTVAGLTERLLGIADKAEKDTLGAPGLSVARASIMDAAKLNGLVVDTVERVQRTPEERARRLAELKAERDATLTRH